ncbi:lipoprotein, partial [Streptomyces sp. NRRL S-444]
MTPRSTARRLQAVGAAAAIAAGTLVATAPAAQAARCTTPQLAAGWYGDNQARLQQLIDEYGKCNPYRPNRNKPVAVFDWDNTVVKNDVGDATMYWLLRNGKIRLPAAGDWTATSRYLTPAAARALADACGALA